MQHLAVAGLSTFVNFDQRIGWISPKSLSEMLQRLDVTKLLQTDPERFTYRTSSLHVPYSSFISGQPSSTFPTGRQSQADVGIKAGFIPEEESSVEIQRSHSGRTAGHHGDCCEVTVTIAVVQRGLPKQPRSLAGAPPLLSTEARPKQARPGKIRPGLNELFTT